MSENNAVMCPEEFNLMKEVLNEAYAYKMQERPIAKLAVALSKAQAAMVGAKKDKQGYGYMYADLAMVCEVLRDPLTSNGLCYSQTVEFRDGHQTLVTRLIHTSGEYLESAMILPTFNKPQEFGSAMTYYRRYSLMAITGLPAEDDDGSAASKAQQKAAPQKPKPVSKVNGPEGKAELEELFREMPEKRAKVCDYLTDSGIPALDCIPKDQHAKIVTQLKADLLKKKKEGE